MINPSAVREEYISGAAQTDFDYGFKIYASTEITAYATAVADLPADDTRDEVVISNITNVGEEDGGVITIPAQDAGTLVTIVSNIPEDRETDYLTNGDFVPLTVNNDFDRLLSIIKQKFDKWRWPKFQESAQGLDDISIESPVAGMLVRVNSTGDGYINSPYGDTGSGGVETVAGLVVDNTDPANPIVTLADALDADDIVAGNLDADYMPASGTWSPAVTITMDGGGNLPLQLLNSGNNVLRITDNETDATDKEAYITSEQYGSSAEPEGFSVIGAFGESGNNQVNIGGRSANHNAATQIWFYTTANTTTRTGSVYNKISSDGRFIATQGVDFDGSGSNARIHDASDGTGSTTLYIGTKEIDVSIPSDLNLKENIVDFPSVIDKLKQLRVVEFNFKSNPDEKHVGMIAQEVELIFPELIKPFKILGELVTQSVDIPEEEAFVNKEFEVEKDEALTTEIKEVPTGGTKKVTIYDVDYDGNVVEKKIKVSKTEEREVRVLKLGARIDSETAKFYIKRKVLAEGVTVTDDKYFVDREVKSIDEFLSIAYKDLIPYIIKAIQEIAI